MTRHLAFPLRVVRGRAVEVQQDTIDHLVDQVLVAVNTDEAWREEAPEFGARPPLMRSGGVDLDTLRAAIVRSVPDAAPIVDRIESIDDLRAERVRVLVSEGGMG